MTAPERIYNWLDSQLSIARHYGAIDYKGHRYIVAWGEPGQPLVRPDVLAREAKEARDAKRKAEAEQPAVQGNALDQGVREELSIGKAINRAARDLPEGWEIRIDLERHAGVVFLIDPDGNETMSENGELFSDQINAAIDAARAAKEGDQHG